LLLDAHRLTGRLPVEIQIQVSRLRHAVKLAIQTQAASQTAVAPPPVRAEVDASPLAKTPYDLRHAALSTWLNGGVPPATVAEWAGHSVEVLLRTYAKCLDSGDALVRPPRPGGARVRRHRRGSVAWPYADLGWFCSAWQWAAVAVQAARLRMPPARRSTAQLRVEPCGLSREVVAFGEIGC